MRRFWLRTLPQIVTFRPSRRSRCEFGDSLTQIENGSEGSFHPLVAHPVQMTAQDVRTASTGVCYRFAKPGAGTMKEPKVTGLPRVRFVDLGGCRQRYKPVLVVQRDRVPQQRQQPCPDRPSAMIVDRKTRGSHDAHRMTLAGCASDVSAHFNVSPA